MDITLMNTEPGFNRCIRVGMAFDKLPEGFVILFSHWSITDVPFTTGIPHKYQVSLPYGKYVQPHQNRIEPYGVAQFINCCVSPNSPATEISGQFRFTATAAALRDTACIGDALLLSTIPHGLLPRHRLHTSTYCH